MTMAILMMMALLAGLALVLSLLGAHWPDVTAALAGERRGQRQRRLQARGDGSAIRALARA